MNKSDPENATPSTRQLIQNTIEVLSKLAEGDFVETQRWIGGKWINDDPQRVRDLFTQNHFKCGYYRRIKPKTEPEQPTTLRPWKSIAEVPIRAWFKHPRSKEWHRVFSVDSHSKTIFLHCYGYMRIERFLPDGWEHSLDNGRTWLPCGMKEEEQE